MVVVIGCWSISVGDFPISIARRGASACSRLRRTTPSSSSRRCACRACSRRSWSALRSRISGGIFQSLARNPLASPDIVGFNSGAALGAVSVIVAVDGARTSEVALGAIAGGVATAALVFVVAWRRGVHGYRLILVGIGVGFAVSAMVDYLLTRAQLYDAQRASVWLTGSLNGRGWAHVGPVGVGLVVLVPAAAVLARRLRMLELGTDTAAALGVHVDGRPVGLVLIGVALAALATASAGPIVFVALVSPPIARRLVRSPGFTLIPTALVGALLVVVRRPGRAPHHGARPSCRSASPRPPSARRTCCGC